MKARSVPRFVRELRNSIEETFRTSKRLSVSDRISGQVMKDEQVVLNFIEQTDIPHWFRGLSEFQLEAASDLCNALRDDILQSTTHRIRSILLRLGLRPQINSNQVTFLKVLCRGNDLAFLWFLMEIHYKHISKNITVNEQIIMSSIAHLDMITTLRELDRILPPAQQTKAEIRKAKREKEAKEKLKRLREEAKKPKIEYVLPYFEPIKRPVIYGNENTIKMPDHRVNFGPYELYKDPTYIVQNEYNRWYKNYKLRPSKRIADWIVKDQINRIFDPETDAAADYDKKEEIICQHHEIVKNLEISLKNELALVAKQRMLDYLDVKKIRSEKACKRIQEQINADVQMYMKQWRQFAKKKSGQMVSVHKFTEHCYHHIRQRINSDEVLPIKICDQCEYESSDEVEKEAELQAMEADKSIEKEIDDTKCMGDHFVVLLDNIKNYEQCCDSELRVGDGKETKRNTLKIESRCCGGRDEKCQIKNDNTEQNEQQVDGGDSANKTHSRLCGGCDDIHPCQLQLKNNKFTAFGCAQLPTGRCCCGALRHRLPLTFVPAPCITSTTSESSARETPAKRAALAQKIIKMKQNALKYPKLKKKVQVDRCADVYMHRYQFGHDENRKLSQSDICFKARRENLPHNFDYFRVFREKPDSDPENINVKQAFVEALDSEIGLLTKNDKNARPKLAEAITACAEKIWQKQLELKNAELEQLKKEAEKKDLHYDLEYYDPENQELMRSMLKDALDVMSKNPKFVLASLPESYKLPMLQEFILHRYGKVYTYKERMRSYTLSKKIFKALDKLTLLVPHPKVKHIYKQMRVDYDCHDCIIEKVGGIKQVFYDKLDDTIMEQARIFWFAMQPYLCTSSPRNTYFAFMPATAMHIHHFRLWQPNEYIAAKEAWYKRQKAKLQNSLLNY